VWVEADEIKRLASFRGETVEQFCAKFVRQVGDRYSLIEKPGGDCIFWDKTAGCTVYPARPNQCQTWPFWPENVETPEDWDHVCTVCPGSGNGQLYTLTEIQLAIATTNKE
jgi:Fe-S-cluster containining protein